MCVVNEPNDTVTSNGLLTLYTDGTSSRDGSGAGVILTSLTGEKFTYVLRFDFERSNNEEE